MRSNQAAVCSSVVLLLAVGTASAAELTKDDLAFFKNRVRSILVEHCQECHGAKKQESGLRLDHWEMMLAGGDRRTPVGLQCLLLDRGRGLKLLSGPRRFRSTGFYPASSGSLPEPPPCSHAG